MFNPGKQAYLPGIFLIEDYIMELFNPNKYCDTVEEFDEYTIVEETFDDEGRLIGRFGVLPVGKPWSKQLLCEIMVSENYPPVKLVKDCLRLCNMFDKMGYRLYAMSVPELSKFFRCLGFEPYGEMDDGYIRWRHNGKT